MKEITDMKINVGDYVDSVFPWLVLNLSKGMDSYTDVIYKGRNKSGVLFTNDDLNKIQTGIQYKLNNSNEYAGYEVTHVQYKNDNENNHSITFKVKKCDKMGNIRESYLCMALERAINHMIDSGELLNNKIIHRFMHNKTPIHPDDLERLSYYLEKKFYQDHHLDIKIEYNQTFNGEYEYALKVDPTAWNKLVPFSDTTVSYGDYNERRTTVDWLVDRLKEETSSITVSFILLHKLTEYELQVFLEVVNDRLLQVRTNDFNLEGDLRATGYDINPETGCEEDDYFQYGIIMIINPTEEESKTCEEEDIMKETVTVINKDEFHLGDEIHHFYVSSDNIQFIREGGVDRLCYELAEQIEFQLAPADRLTAEVLQSFEIASKSSEVDLSKLIQDHVQHFLNLMDVSCRVQTPKVDWLAGGLFLKVVAIKK